jgi:hypothetical protein
MQMAVETNKTRQIGKLLVNNYCLFCKSNGIKEVVVTSENAVPFYLNQDSKYTMNHLEVGIKHSHMRINLKIN